MVWYCLVRYGIVWYGMVLSGMAWHGMWYGMWYILWCDTVSAHVRAHVRFVVFTITTRLCVVLKLALLGIHLQLPADHLMSCGGMNVTCVCSTREV